MNGQLKLQVTVEVLHKDKNGKVIEHIRETDGKVEVLHGDNDN